MGAGGSSVEQPVTSTATPAAERIADRMRMESDVIGIVAFRWMSRLELFSGDQLQVLDLLDPPTTVEC